MSDLRDSFQERLFNAYSNWYDIDFCPEEKSPLIAVGAFHEKGSAYLLTEKATMWETNRNEYVYFFSLPHLDEETFSRCLAQAIEMGDARIVPHKDHMCSYIVAEFICETADPEAVAALKKVRRRKNFKFGLQGWSEVHTAVIELGKNSVSGNGDGRQTVRFVSDILTPAKKRGFLQKLF